MGRMVSHCYQLVVSLGFFAAVASFSGLTFAGEPHLGEFDENAELVEIYDSQKWSKEETPDGTGYIICGGEFSRDSRCLVEAEGISALFGIKDPAPYLQLSEAMLTVNPRASITSIKRNGPSLEVRYVLASRQGLQQSVHIPKGFGIDFRGSTSDRPVLNLWYWVGFWMVIILSAAAYVFHELMYQRRPLRLADENQVSPELDYPLTMLPTEEGQSRSLGEVGSGNVVSGVAADHSGARRKIVLD